MDVESLLRSTELPEVSVDTEAALASTTQAGRRRRRRRATLAGSFGGCAVVIIAVLLTVTLVRSDDGPGLEVATGPDQVVAPPSGSWRPLAPSPLSARDQGVAAWTGSEVVIVGGSDTTPCPANADCLIALDPLADGSAYDPVTDRWRRIADAPIPFVGGLATWTGSEVLVLAQRQDLNTPDALLAYDPEADRWETRADPPADLFRSMAWTGDSWVGITPHWRQGANAWRYRPAIDAWEAVSPDPVGELSDRSVVWTGTELVLIGSQYGPGPPNGFWEAAVLEPDGSWRQLPMSDIANNGHEWSAIDGLVVNLGSGPQNEHETGGVLDPSTGSWAHLPPNPPRQGGSTGYEGVAGPWVVSFARLFDPAAQQWWAVEERPDEVSPAVAVWTGNEIVSWGGTIQHQTSGPELVASGLAYRPPGVDDPDQDGDVVVPPTAEAEPGDAAVWHVDPASPPSSGSSTFTAMVARLDCNGGVTGTVLRPGIAVTDSEVVVTFTVEPLPDDGVARACPDNAAVPYRVDIGQPVGDRILVDGACDAGGPAVATRFCNAGAGTRWRAEGAPRPKRLVPGRAGRLRHRARPRRAGSSRRRPHGGVPPEVTGAAGRSGP